MMILDRGYGVLKKLSRKRILLLTAAVGLILVAAAGATAAALAAQSLPLSNTFGIAEITSKVEETFSDGVKSDVSIRNTGTMDAYIRAALVPVWKNGAQIVGVSASLNNCVIDWGSGYGSTWVKGKDGYYYCTVPVPAGQCTPILIDQCTAAPNGDNHLELQINAQAIQALPSSAVTGAWDSAVTGVKTNGNLEVAP